MGARIPPLITGGLDYDRSPNDGISHARRNIKVDVNHIRERKKPGIKLEQTHFVQRLTRVK